MQCPTIRESTSRLTALLFLPLPPFSFLPSKQSAPVHQATIAEYYFEAENFLEINIDRMAHPKIIPPTLIHPSRRDAEVEEPSMTLKFVDSTALSDWVVKLQFDQGGIYVNVHRLLAARLIILRRESPWNRILC